MFYSCKKENETNELKKHLKVEPEKLHFNFGEASNTIQIETEIDWWIESNQSWCTLSSLSGMGNATITVSVTANTNPTERTAILTISSKSHKGTQKITVTQAGGPSYDIYVAGQNAEGYATYWKNGVAYVNKNLQDSYIAIAVSDGGDVYMVRFYDEKYNSKYWKNGTMVNFTNESGAIALGIIAVLPKG